MTLISVKMKWFECWACGLPFGMPAEYETTCRRKETTFYCPRGCRLVFGESEATRLKRELERAQSKLRVAEQETAQARRKAKRYKCPDCTRDFATAKGVKKHQRLTHMSPLALTEDAGPNAYNSKVN